MTGPWAVVATEEFEEWMMSLTYLQRDALEDRIQMLRVRGPALTRPTVGHITNSRHKNMKELRPGSSGRSELRILFVFDPDRKAIMLVAGDKSGTWSKWYRTSIRKADQLYTEHVEKRKQAQ